MGSPARLKILQLLSNTDKMGVSDLTHELGIAFKNTSRNLGILLNLDLVEFEGKQGRVFYRINPNVEKDVGRILEIFMK